jgi:hypothetical protein
MFQTSEASRRSRGTHGGACHGVVLEQSDKRRRTRSSAGRIGERNMAVGRRPGRCPNVGGALPPSRTRGTKAIAEAEQRYGETGRAAIEREAGARCPHATSWLCGSYRTVGSVGTHSTAHRNRRSCRAVLPKRRVGSDQSDLSDLSDGFPAAVQGMLQASTDCISLACRPHVCGGTIARRRRPPTFDCSRKRRQAGRGTYLGPVRATPHALSLSDSSHSPAVHDPATPILLPMVLPPRACSRRARPAGDGPAIATTVGRSAKAGRLRALQGGVTAEDRGLQGTRPTLSRIPVSGIAPRVVPGPIGVDSRDWWPLQRATTNCLRIACVVAMVCTLAIVSLNTGASVSCKT